MSPRSSPKSSPRRSALIAAGVQIEPDVADGTLLPDLHQLQSDLLAGQPYPFAQHPHNRGVQEPLPIETRCLHTGSLATALAPGRTNVEDLLGREHQRGRVTISYDPNVRPALLGTPERALPGIERLVALCDVVKVSDEDLLWLYPDRRDEDVAREWLGRGPALVVVTRGNRGVYAGTAALEVRRPATPIDLVDTVGAGDSFTSGLLDGLRRADLIGGPRRDALAAVDESTLVSVVEDAAHVAASANQSPPVTSRPVPVSVRRGRCWSSARESGPSPVAC